MSFAFLPLYTGDYQRDTLHLSMLEHGAYFKLLMYCWDQKGPAPHDERKLMGICNARSKEEITAMQSVLCEFFTRMDDGWYNKRLSQELAKSEEQAAKAHDRGLRSAEARRQKYGTAQPFESVSKAFRKAPESLPNPPSPSPSPSSLKEEKTYTRQKALVYLSSLGVEEQFASDWLAVRKAKSLATTKTAIDHVAIEADKAGVTINEAVKTCCANSWAGFKASWLQSAKSVEYDYSGVRD